ncbi:amino acid permease [Sphingomonas sp. LB2R24]|uniref:amino acid permease n=1 Tax=Sphingomonas sorbitolis TaxID=3096165 RepID=UPI002FC76640
MPEHLGRRMIARLKLRKSVAQVQLEAQTSELTRSLGPANLVFLGIGCIIGAGIFVRTGNAAALHAGPAVLISFLIAGIVCGLTGLCYAELSSTLPVSGSAYTYCYTTIGEFAAWLMGSLLLLEYGLAASVISVGWSGYVVSLLNDFGIHIPVELAGPMGHVAPDGTVQVFNLPAFGLCAGMAFLLFLGVSKSAKFNNVIVSIKLTVLIAFILVVGWHIAQNFDTLKHNWTPFIPEPTGRYGEFGWSGVLRGASIVFFAYVGFEAVSTAGQEAKNPERDMPIGIIGSLVACTIIYILISIVLTLMVNYTHLNTPDPIAVAVDALGPKWRWFSMLVKSGAIIGLTSVVLILMYGQTRVFYTMARDGLLPRIFSFVHPRFKSPSVNTVVVGLIVSISAGFAEINTMGDMTSVGTLTAFAIVCSTVIWLRRTHPELTRGFSVPFYPVLPVLGILACLFLIMTVEVHVLKMLSLYLVGSTVVYFLYGFRHSALARERGLSGDER